MHAPAQARIADVALLPGDKRIPCDAQFLPATPKEHARGGVYWDPAARYDTSP